MSARTHRALDGAGKDGLEVTADRRVRDAQLLGDAGLGAVGPAVAEHPLGDLDAPVQGAVAPQGVVPPATTDAGGSLAIRDPLRPTVAHLCPSPRCMGHVGVIEVRVEPVGAIRGDSSVAAYPLKAESSGAARSRGRGR